MSEAAINEDLTVIAAFTKSRALATGLTVTVDGYDQLGVKIISDAAATEIDILAGSGLYMYTLDDAYNDASGLYSFVFKTTDAEVDIKQVPAAVIVRGNNTSPAGTLPILSDTALVWADIMDYISAFVRSENATPNAGIYIRLANVALQQISRKTLCYERVLTNVEGGELSISGNIVTAIHDIIRVDRMEWDGSEHEVVRTTATEMDAAHCGWRDATGDPHHYVMVDAHTIMLSRAPTGGGTGKLTVRARCYLPVLTDNDDVQNPLVFLPTEAQLAPAYFVVANLPLPLIRVVNDSREAVIMAQRQMDVCQATRAEHKAKYEEAIAGIIEVCDRKIEMPFSGF